MNEAFRCPVCERRFPRTARQTMPFCSTRCQQIDLGRWLGEQYTVPEPPSLLDPDEFVDGVPPDQW
ncbi:MAG: DNA gyrase inhibitor YacG [Planctomycetales bacterium]|nr:DNA gyrase inhibitor YacG [Planctomycetales bacterium]